MKKERFRIESDIINRIYKDNGNTVHFDYHVDIDRNLIRLDLFTVNRKNGQVFLLHQTEGSTSLGALTLMFNYIVDRNKDKAPYTVTWEKKGEGEEHISYFWENSEMDVINKFFYDKDPDDYVIKVELKPLS